MDSPQLITLDVRLLTGDQENIKHRFGTAVKTPHSLTNFCNHHNSEIKLISTPKLSKSSAAHMFFLFTTYKSPPFRCNPHLSTGKHRPQELYLDPVVAVILLLLAALFAAGTMITTRRGLWSRNPHFKRQVMGCTTLSGRPISYVYNIYIYIMLAA